MSLITPDTCHQGIDRSRDAWSVLSCVPHASAKQLDRQDPYMGPAGRPVVATNGLYVALVSGVVKLKAMYPGRHLSAVPTPAGCFRPAGATSLRTKAHGTLAS